MYTSVNLPAIAHSAVVWWTRVKLKTASRKLEHIQRLACLCTTGAVRTTPALHMYLQQQAMLSRYRLKLIQTYGGDTRLKDQSMVVLIVTYEKWQKVTSVYFDKNYTVTAGVLAKQVICLEYIGVNPVIGITQRMARTEVWTWAESRFCKLWQSKHGCRQVDISLHGPDKQLSRYALCLGRKRLRILVALLTQQTSVCYEGPHVSTGPQIHWATDALCHRSTGPQIH